MDWKTVLTLTENYVPHGVIMDQPEGEVKTYMRGGTYIDADYYIYPASGKVNVVWGENNAVYIQNPFAGVNTGAWVAGQFDPTTTLVTVPLGQFIYENVESEWGAVMGWGNLDVDADGYVTMNVDADATEAVFAFDPEMKTLTLLDCTQEIAVDEQGNIILPATYSGLLCYYSDDFGFVELDLGNTMTEFELVPAVPANPTADEWYDCGNEGGYSRFYFTLPTTDVDGNALDVENISYSIFVDNGDGPEMFTFPAVDYTFDLSEDITEVPYELYSNAVDFRNYFVYLYRTNAEGFEPLFTENIGIQAYYTVNGVKNASDIVWLYEKHVGVDELNADKTVANVRYFNVAGQEMAQPQGMTIMVTTYTDGTKSAVKVVK
jgi:hypothetical protein